MSPAKKPVKSKVAASKAALKKVSAKGKAAAKSAARKAAAPKKKAAAKGTAKKTAERAGGSKKSTSAKGSSKSSTGKASKAGTRAQSSTKSVRKKVAARPSTGAARTPSRPPRARPTRPAKFDKKALAAVREKLLEKKKELEEQLHELEVQSFVGTQSDLTGEIGIDEDFADAGTATFERERDLSIRNNIDDLLDQVIRSIGRIDEGTYGTCERCGRPIDATRLRELPYALLCLDCKRREERAR